MKTSWSIVFRLVVIGCAIGIAYGASGAETSPARVRRVLYNFDGDSCLTTKAHGTGPVAVTRDDVVRLIDEVAYEASQVDTILICVNAQVMYYPTRVGTMRGQLSTADERATWPASEKQRFVNLERFFAENVDPYAVMIAEGKRRGREMLLTFRMNDAHGNDFLRTQFAVDHPPYVLGNGALNFAHAEVRDHTLALLEEALRRYDVDGLELDFNRFPRFFVDGTGREHVATMNQFVQRVRTLVLNVARERHRTLVLGVRVPSNFGATPPTPDSTRALGCDVVEWAAQGWIDYVAVSEFLFERGDLPIDQWREAISPKSIPVYGGIECTRGGNARNLTADAYRDAARHLMKSRADGVYLFNFFTSRELGADAYEPPYDVLDELVE